MDFCTLTLSKSEAVTACAGGHFSRPASHANDSSEFALARGGTDLEPVTLDSQGNIKSICRTSTFALIHSISVLKSEDGARPDRLVVGSDSGASSFRLSLHTHIPYYFC